MLTNICRQRDLYFIILNTYGFIRMAYIEENMKTRRQPQGNATEDDLPNKSSDSKDALYQLPEKYKIQQKPVNEEGNVTNSLAMLTAIPEVDLGMEYVSLHAA